MQELKPQIDEIGSIFELANRYGPFLCTCVVTFENEESIDLYRYIDFEMQWAMALVIESVDPKITKEDRRQLLEDLGLWGTIWTSTISAAM